MSTNESDDDIVVTSDRRGRSRSAAWQKWSRLLHVYTSMISLVVVLFFAITGLTLNHPSWGLKVSRTNTTGTLPAAWKEAETVDWLVVSEHLRTTEGVKGAVSDRRSDDRDGSITFENPGYSANALIDVSDGTYDLAVETQGFTALINDLHKGRHSRDSWRWLIDASAIFLVLVSVTGLVLQLFLKRRRRSAVITATIAGLVTLALAWLAAS